ncbi:MAG TPA: beta-L-arabinofuranosidase domain-containing protein [Sediminibacterium sp.]|nr:beta-L-arabinofuranosidase domain-containing protein [Sediminibacterium sp.]
MLKSPIIFLSLIGLLICANISAQDYPARTPLHQNPYMELPLGAIQPKGWLLDMLIRQKNGATGQLDELYPQVMGKRNGWLGGDGDQWERGPYWIDGLLPLAYILHDQSLIDKVKPWIEWSIQSQQPDGYFGPSKDYPAEKGLQRNNSRDWWPKIVMLKVLQQYYSATGDKRIIRLLTNYFRYQLKELPVHPLDNWTFWARYRGGDNLMVVYWLYNITGDHFLLDLAELIHRQTFDYTGSFLHTDLMATNGSIHGVNLGQGIKEPAIYYQQHPDQQYLDALKKGFHDLTRYNGMPNGMFGADESLHGNNPTQGSELCTAVELMFSLENILAITGDAEYADRLERIAFNALPTQTTEDYMGHQYFQQANQVMLTRHDRNFDVNHSGTDIVYGLLTGYPCCTSNMHQGWPKFTQSLWFATADKGLAALVYSASEVKARVADAKEVTVAEETQYPFGESIRFRLSMQEAGLSFPLHLRIPAWCTQASIQVNGETVQTPGGGQIVVLQRNWKKGDVVELQLPMHIFKNKWYEQSISVERGPIVYALKIGEAVKQVTNTKDPEVYGKTYTEVLPTTPWNYGLASVPDAKFAESFTVQQKKSITLFPWTPGQSSIQLLTKGRQVANWKLYNDMAGPQPYSMIYNERTTQQPDQTITLIPYGCTRLRIAEFPVIR